MKKIIRLTGKELKKKIIKENIHRYILENDFSNKGYSGIGDESVEGQLDDYLSTPLMRKIRSEFNLKMNGYTNIDGKTGIILDCSNLTWHDSERHGAEVNISLKDHCIVISFDGEKYYMHLIYKKTNSDVTTPQMIPMFDDHMRSGAFDTKILRVFLYMIKKGIKIEEKDNSAEDLSYGSYDYIDKHDNYDPSFAPDRNPNITNTHYSKSYADNEKRRNGTGEWEMICHNTLLVVKTKVINGNLKN